MSREIFIVAGLASKAANLAPLSLLASQHQNQNRVHFIDGASFIAGEPRAVSPSRQALKIQEIFRASPVSNAIIYTQSIGVLAAIRCLETLGDGNVRALAIAPPLPRPSDTINHARVRGRMMLSGGKVTIPSYSFALGESGPSDQPPVPVSVHIDSEYFDEIYADSKYFLDKVETLTTRGLLKIVMPRQDWNSGALELANNFSGTTTIDGSHSLHGDTLTMVANARSLYALAGSFE